MAPRQPTSAEALVGSLSAHRRSAALLDVGSGLGYFSLAAAARGHRVISYEWGESAVPLLRASIAHNGFGPRVELRTARVGGRGEEFCRTLTEREIVRRDARRWSEVAAGAVPGPGPGAGGAGRACLLLLAMSSNAL